ncbi:MAG: hypothetical protein ACPGU4_07095 [Flavobacteriales bacterium]
MMADNNSKAIIFLSTLMLTLDFLGNNVQNVLAGTIMLNLNVVVSFIVIVLIVLNTIRIVRTKKMNLIPAVIIGTVTIFFLTTEPFVS